MLTEETGLLEAEEGEATADITQHDIVKHVDMQSAQKVSHSLWVQGLGFLILGRCRCSVMK